MFHTSYCCPPPIEWEFYVSYFFYTWNAIWSSLKLHTLFTGSVGASCLLVRGLFLVVWFNFARLGTLASCMFMLSAFVYFNFTGLGYYSQLDLFFYFLPTEVLETMRNIIVELHNNPHPEAQAKNDLINYPTIYRD
jgi:hypothetical protein